MLSLITFTDFYFFLLTLRKSCLQVYGVLKLHVFVCILRKFRQRDRGVGGRGCILNGIVLILMHCHPYLILEERTKIMLIRELLVINVYYS